jgi:hypothetical protein
MKMLLWDETAGEWVPLPGWNPYGPEWWFEVIPGAWANVLNAHVRMIGGRRFQVCLHPRLPGRFLGYFVDPAPRGSLA